MPPFVPMSRWRAGATLSLALVASGPVLNLVAQPPATPALYVLEANVLEGSSLDARRGVTVVVENGRITRLEDGRATPPASALTIDAKGRWLLPGLIDTHSHLNTLAAARRALHSGATTIRTAGVGGFGDVAIRDLVRAGRLPGPDILATGVYVTPDLEDAVLWDARLFPLAAGVRTIDGLRTLVRVNAAHRVDWIKTRGTERAGRPETDPREQVYSEAELRAVVEEASRAGIPIMAHAHGDEGTRAAVLAGVKSIEHGTYASDETLRLMKARGTWLVPTMSSVTSFGQPGDYNDPALFLRGLHTAPRRFDTLRRAWAMGIPVAAGVDTSYGPESTARIAREVGLLVEGGLPPFDALAAATSRAAEMLGIADRTGSIRPGYEADLVLVDRNPLEDIVALQDVLVVISNGQLAVNRIPKVRDEYR